MTAAAKRELFVLSFLSLFVELLVIRWLSCDVRGFVVFRTFPLIACFIGLGVGCALSKDKPFKYAAEWLFILAVMIKAAELVGFSYWSFPSASVFQWQNFMLTPQHAGQIGGFLVVILLILAAAFAAGLCIGSRLGVLFDSLPPLTAYSINILGAITGSIAFPLLCFFGLPPWVLLFGSAAALAAESRFVEKRWRWQSLLLLLIPIVFLLFPQQYARPFFKEFMTLPHDEPQTFWSPYQRLDLTVFHAPKEIEVESGPILPSDKATGKSSFLCLELGVNRAFYQWYFNSAIKSTIASMPNVFESRFRNYEMPFRFNAPKNVLVVGAGTGQNVSAALKLGAEHVDAVEIDPLIIEVGRRYNPDYARAKVSLICDDARHFFRTASSKYDAIVFSLLDSQAVSSLGSSVRLDTYVYTRESFQQALSLLNPTGVMVVWYGTEAPWMKARLFNTLRASSDYRPLLVNGPWPMSSMFVMGQPVKAGTMQLPSGCSAEDSRPLDQMDQHVLTDDWPYLYVNPNVFDAPYWIMVGAIVALAIFAARGFLLVHSRPVYWQMFFLGAAFLMLELHAISFLSLLYGSTWLTSAIVINGILVMIFFANLAVMRLRTDSMTAQTIMYGALIGSILLSYFTPVEQVLSAMGNSAGASLLISLITLLPMGMAAIVFSSGFRRADDAAKALAFNLCGAVVGGLLEYASNYVGIKNLELLAAFLYLISFACMVRQLAGAPAAQVQPLPVVENGDT